MFVGPTKRRDSRGLQDRSSLSTLRGGIATRGIFHRYQLVLVTGMTVTECDSDGAVPMNKRSPAGGSRQAQGYRRCRAWFRRGMPDKWVNRVWAHARVLWWVTRSPVGARGVFECAGGKEPSAHTSHGLKMQSQLFRPGQCAPPYF